MPLTTVLILHFLGIIPLTLFNYIPSSLFTAAFFLFLFTNTFLHHVLFTLLQPLLPTELHGRQVQFSLIKCFSLLILGMALSALSTLNFSLALMVGLSSVPLTFVPVGNIAGVRDRSLRWTMFVVLQVFSPGVALMGVAKYWGVGVDEVLREAAFGWWVSGMWTQVVVWCVWWPAWLCGGVLLVGRLMLGKGDEKEQKEAKGKLCGDVAQKQ